MKICVYGASSNAIDQKFITAGEMLGECLAKNGHAIVYGAGAHGMMGAVARGMSRYDGEIIGVSPTFFKVDGVLYEHCTEMIYTETMRERKQQMEELSDAFVVTPGGVGTFDEFFEILTLRQLGRHKKPVIIFNTHGYFDPLLAMLDSAIEQNFMTATNRKLFSCCATPEDVLTALEAPIEDTSSIAAYKSVIL